MIEPKHHKNNFLIERIAFFSDAVFAIAITLLIIEIHPPKVHKGDTAEMVWHHFRETIPEFMGLFVSFLLIGGAWLRHHSLFKYVDNYDFRFMAINMALLFTIILFPFSTSFLFNNLFEGGISKLQVYIYLGVPYASNLILYIMFRRVNRKHLEGEADERFHKALFSQLWMLIAFTCAIIWIILAPLEIHYYGYFFLYIGPLMIMINKRKLKRQHAQPVNTPTN